MVAPGVLMLIIALIFLVTLMLAAFCALRLTRTTVAPDVTPMKAALERRMREGAEFRL